MQAKDKILGTKLYMAVCFYDKVIFEQPKLLLVSWIKINVAT
jgi:hypothetical protein